MDAANYAKALKKADDASIVETKLTEDGVEDFAYGGGRGMGGDQQQQEQNDNQQGENQDNTRQRSFGRQRRMVARFEEVRPCSPRFAQG